MPVTRPSRAEIDAEIVDVAARLFARHGFEQTSLQRVADAVGYSKTGLLHHFPTKEALQDAAIDSCLQLVRDLHEQVADAGRDRDRILVEQIVDVALAHSGLVSLMITAGVSGEPLSQRIVAVFDGLVDAFGADPTAERAVRITVALGGLALAAVACTDNPEFTPAAVRPHLVAAALDALGPTAL